MEGYVNVDIVKLPGVDIVHDLNKPLPFKDGSIDEIRAFHVFEHLGVTRNGWVDVLKDWKRVLKPGGHIIIQVPFGDGFVIGHTTAFSDKSFLHLKKGRRRNYEFGLSFSDVRVKLKGRRYMTEWTRFLWPFLTTRHKALLVFTIDVVLVA